MADSYFKSVYQAFDNSVYAHNVIARNDISNRYQNMFLHKLKDFEKNQFDLIDNLTQIYIRSKIIKKQIELIYENIFKNQQNFQFIIKASQLNYQKQLKLNQLNNQNLLKSPLINRPLTNNNFTNFNNNDYLIIKNNNKGLNNECLNIAINSKNKNENSVSDNIVIVSNNMKKEIENILDNNLSLDLVIEKLNMQPQMQQDIKFWQENLIKLSNFEITQLDAVKEILNLPNMTSTIEQVLIQNQLNGKNNINLEKFLFENNKFDIKVQQIGINLGNNQNYVLNALLNSLHYKNNDNTNKVININKLDNYIYMPIINKQLFKDVEFFNKFLMYYQYKIVNQAIAIDKILENPKNELVNSIKLKDLYKNGETLNVYKNYFNSFNNSNTNMAVNVITNELNPLLKNDIKNLPVLLEEFKIIPLKELKKEILERLNIFNQRLNLADKNYLTLQGNIKENIKFILNYNEELSNKNQISLITEIITRNKNFYFLLPLEYQKHKEVVFSALKKGIDIDKLLPLDENMRDIINEYQQQINMQPPEPPAPTKAVELQFNQNNFDDKVNNTNSDINKFDINNSKINNWNDISDTDIDKKRKEGGARSVSDGGSSGVGKSSVSGGKSSSSIKPKGM